MATKLVAPTLPRGYRERPRLSRRLDAALEDGTRLTLLSAPPGYGKSLAVTGWLASRGLACAWLSLEPADNDPVRFVHYLVAALRGVRRDAGEATLGLVATGATPTADLIGATIVGEMSASDDAFVLVLDDCHAVTSALVNELVRFLVQHAPPFAHLVLIARHDPPLPLARLRAHARLVELRSDDLRFTADEASAFLGDVMGSELAPELAARVADRTEGWAAALQLAALTLRDGPDAAAQVEALAASRRAVFDYLADEVVGGLDEELRTFLVRTSVAERFTVELCAELAGRPDAATLLDRAEQANLFLTPVASDGRWYRYHPLFAEYLRTLLGEPDRRALHAATAAHLERAGLRPEAIGHALAAGALDTATRLIELEARHAFESGQLLGLLGWLDALPPGRVAASPELMSLQGWAYLFTGQVGAAMACAQRDLGAPDAGQAEGRLLALRAVLATITESGAEELATAALGLLGDDHFFRAIALLALGMERWTNGELAAGIEAWTTALDVAMLAGQPMAVTLAATALASGLHDTGARPAAESLCRRVLEEHVGADGRPHPMAWFVRMPLGMLLYEANDVAGARRELERGFEGAGVFGFGRVLAGFAVEYLALARQATGSPEEALDAVRATSQALRRAGITNRAKGALEARIDLVQGNLDAAAAWADQPLPGAPPDRRLPDALVIEHGVTIGRVRLAQRRFGDASRVLAEARAVAERVGLVAELISIRILESAAAEGAGDRTAALHALGDAIRLAAPGGYVRRFVDDGASIARLLPHVARAAPAFVDQVIAALAAPIHARGRGSAVWQDEEGELVESLTARESDVLRLMARGARNAEIAVTLEMSPGTARWHVGNILSKLGARNRTQALVRAQHLGLV